MQVLEQRAAVQPLLANAANEADQKREQRLERLYAFVHEHQRMRGRLQVAPLQVGDVISKGHQYAGNALADGLQVEAPVQRLCEFTYNENQYGNVSAGIRLTIVYIVAAGQRGVCIVLERRGGGYPIWSASRLCTVPMHKVADALVLDGDLDDVAEDFVLPRMQVLGRLFGVLCGDVN